MLKRGPLGMTSIAGKAAKLARPTSLTGLQQMRPATKRKGALSSMMGMAEGGAPGGQADVVPAMLAPGEYVMDAEVVSMLGDGSNDAGAAILDKFREAIRAHKRSAPINKIPPKARSPLAYMKGAR